MGIRRMKNLAPAVLCGVLAACGSSGAPTQPCPAGAYRPAGGECTPWAVCGANEIAHTEPTPTADRECRPCAPGECTTAMDPPPACGAGTWASGGGTAECVAWSDCPAGSFVKQAGTTTTDRQCLACPAGNAGPANAPSCNVATQLVVGGRHTCVLLTSGRVRCWGNGAFGQLGYANTRNIGDDETPASAGDVDLGGPALQIAAGGTHTCALLATGNVRCWGQGPLGYGNLNTIGDDETPASAGDIDLGGKAVRIAGGGAGGPSTCAILDGGKLRCWRGSAAILGYAPGRGSEESIGDDETPASVGDIDVGGPVAQVSVGGSHICAIRTDGTLICWGDNYAGELGRGNTADIGDDETPGSVGPIDLGETVVQVAAGGLHTCALLVSGEMRCWGYDTYGSLGINPPPELSSIDESGHFYKIFASARPLVVPVPDAVSAVVAGLNNTCALMAGQGVRCWGMGLGLGYPRALRHTDNAALVPNVEVGGAVAAVATGDQHTCVLLVNGNVRCWGGGGNGQLGYARSRGVPGNPSCFEVMDPRYNEPGGRDPCFTIGDVESPASAGDVPYFD